VVVMAVGPFLSWKRSDLAGTFPKLYAALGLAVLVALAAWYFHRGGPVLAVVALFAAAWLLFATLAELVDRLELFRTSWRDSLERARKLPRAAYGMTLAHAGLALVIAGATGASLWREEHIQSSFPGDAVEVGGYEVILESVRQKEGPNYLADQGQFMVLRGGRQVALLEPEKRVYSVTAMPTTEAAIHTTGRGDLYVVLGDQAEDNSGAWTTRLFFTPLVVWMWIGALVMVAGGLLSLSDRRLRVGTPRRSKVQDSGKEEAA
jgi:cytochrome c-type biogenesis protein CcmF